MYYVMRASAPSLHRESTDSLIGETFAHIYLMEPIMKLCMQLRFDISSNNMFVNNVTCIQQQLQPLALHYDKYKDQ